MLSRLIKLSYLKDVKSNKWIRECSFMHDLYIKFQFNQLDYVTKLKQTVI